jgi:hypothetical protein
MGCITVSGESKPAPLGVSELVILCPLQVLEEMLDSVPMLGTPILAETTKEAHGLRNVRLSQGTQVLEGANRTEIWHRVVTGLQSCIPTIALEHVNDILALGKGDLNTE